MGEILRFLSTQCTLGADTDTMDSDLTDMYDDDELFGYQQQDSDSDYYNANADTDSDLDNYANQNFEEYLAQYFEEDSDGYGDSEYYDDTDLYFDNKDLTGEEGEDDDDDNYSEYTNGDDLYDGEDDTDTDDEMIDLDG